MDHTHHPLPDSPPPAPPGDSADCPLLPSRADPDVGATPPASLHTDDTTIRHIVDDVIYAYKNILDIYDTYFYKVVLGGHLETVKQVIEYMEQNDLVKELSWLLRTRKDFVYRKYYRPITEQSRLKMARVALTTIAGLLCILFSPVFYILHGLSATFLRQKRTFLWEKIDLPLAFAAYSQSPEMVSFFFSKNVNLYSTDKDGNNVFHYIANLSITASGSACAAFATVVDNLEFDHNLLYPLLYEKVNTSGMTALEYVARFGSPSLLTRMMNAEPRLRQVRFSVTAEGVMLKPFHRSHTLTRSHTFPRAHPPPAAAADIEKTPSIASTTSLHSLTSLSTLNDPKHSDDTRAKQAIAAAATTREDYVDVTRYEGHNIARRSFLLRLIAYRNVSTFSVKDIGLFQRCPVIGKWIQLKVQEMRKYIIAVYCLDVVVTALLLGLLFSMHGNTDLNLQLRKKAMRVELQEYDARAQGTSKILTSTALEHVLQKQAVQFQLQRILAKAENADSLVDNANNALRLNISTGNLFSQNVTAQEAFVRYALAQFPQTPAIVAVANLKPAVQTFTEKLVETYPDLAQRDINTNNLHTFEKTVSDFLQKFEMHSTVDTYNGSFKLSAVMSVEDWRKMLCPCASDLPPDAFLRPQRIPSQHFPDDICSWQSVLIMAEETCERKTLTQVYQKLDAILEASVQRQSFVTATIIILVILAVVYVMIDTYEHWVFFYYVIQSSMSVMEMVHNVCAMRVPGSYYRKQLNVLTSYVIISHLCARAQLVSDLIPSVLLEKYTYYLLLFGLILRFIMHIHCMRLLPWIGHFIITTFMMANNLMHFSTVLGLVIIIFSIIFNLLIVDKDCPVQRFEGYDTVGHSMLSVFMLTFGHGDFDQYRTSFPVIVTYVLFVIIVGLLLLNLIIAIMSATAEDLMTPDGKATLRKIEWMYEALSIEYTVTTLAATLNARWLYGENAKKGYYIQGKGEDAKVFIRVFYCDKLD